MSKEKDIEFIKSFSSIKLLYIFKKYKIDSSNFYKGKVSEEKLKLVKNDLDKKIIQLYSRRLEDES